MENFLEKWNTKVVDGQGDYMPLELVIEKIEGGKASEYIASPSNPEAKVIVYFVKDLTVSNIVYPIVHFARFSKNNNLITPLAKGNEYNGKYYPNAVGYDIYVAILNANPEKVAELEALPAQDFVKKLVGFKFTMNGKVGVSEKTGKDYMILETDYQKQKDIANRQEFGNSTATPQKEVFTDEAAAIVEDALSNIPEKKADPASDLPF